MSETLLRAETIAIMMFQLGLLLVFLTIVSLQFQVTIVERRMAELGIGLMVFSGVLAFGIMVWRAEPNSEADIENST